VNAKTGATLTTILADVVVASHDAQAKLENLQVHPKCISCGSYDYYTVTKDSLCLHRCQASLCKWIKIVSLGV
jgi:hypothetical protein